MGNVKLVYNHNEREKGRTLDPAHEELYLTKFGNSFIIFIKMCVVSRPDK